MTPNLLPLYVACFAMIGLLGGFAHHNKRTGWVKKRRSLFEDLLELQAFAKDLEGSVGGAEPAVQSQNTRLPMRMENAPSVREAAQFSAQLSGLSTGLKSGMNPVSPEAAVEEHAVDAEHISA